MAQTIEAESPRSYFWWSGLCAISAALSNRVWIDKQIYKLHPNLYVLLIGKSGLRKSGPPALVKQIVEKAEIIKVISGRSSIQAIVKELGSVWNLESGKMLAESTAFICSTEFSSSLVKDDDALTILTDLHDSHYHPNGWKNILKTAGVDILKHPCLTLLSATNPIHFDDKISEVSMMGGFIARTILVVEDKKSRINDLLDPPEIRFDPEYFVPYLRTLSQLKGEMILTKEAKQLFRDWYQIFSEQESDDKTGTSERIHDRILKVAMCIAVTEEPELLIREKHMQAAMDVCIRGVSVADRATMGQGKSEYASRCAYLIELLLKMEGYEIERKKLLSRAWGTFDADTLDRVAETLDQGDMIEIENKDGKLFYRLTQGTIDYYSK